MIWPPAATAAEFDAVRRDEDALRPGIEILCRLRGASEPAVRFADGSLPVYAVGPDLVLKVYPPIYRSERDREQLVLEALSGRLPIPTPQPLGAGELDGWGFLWMSRLTGQSLALAWPEVDRPRVARELGEGLAALHAVRDPRLDALDDWEAFASEQRRTAVERQRARGLDERWLEQIPGFLEGLALDGPRVLLHTEVMREHLLIDGSERLSGLFDFEPARLGPPEYELSSVGLFVSGGDPRLFLEILRGYGHGTDPELPRRVMGHALLHQYSNFPWYLRRVPPPDGVVTLEALAEVWFGTGFRAR